MALEPLALLAPPCRPRHLTAPSHRGMGTAPRLFPDHRSRRPDPLSAALGDARARVLASWVTIGFTFVDVGANVGGYAFWLLSRLGASGRVVAVEPNPDLARQLRFNVRTNEAEERLRVVEAAVGAERGSGTLLVSGRNSGESRLVQSNAAAGASRSESGLDEADAGVEAAGRDAAAATIPVDVVTLADVVRDAGLYRIDCLKVDVEGHEAEVIQPFLRSSPRALWPAPDRRTRAGVRSPGGPELENWLLARVTALFLTRLNGLFTLASGSRACLVGKVRAARSAANRGAIA